MDGTVLVDVDLAVEVDVDVTGLVDNDVTVDVGLGLVLGVKNILGRTWAFP